VNLYSNVLYVVTFFIYVVQILNSPLCSDFILYKYWALNEDLVRFRLAGTGLTTKDWMGKGDHYYKVFCFYNNIKKKI
jgi:hypothetical protein